MTIGVLFSSRCIVKGSDRIHEKSDGEETLSGYTCWSAELTPRDRICDCLIGRTAAAQSRLQRRTS